MNQFSTYYHDTPAPNQPLPTITQWCNQPDFFDNISKAAHTLLDPIAIDKGYYPIKEMSELARLGAFSTHLNSQGNRLGDAILSTAKIGEVCGTTGFYHGVIKYVLYISTNPIIPNWPTAFYPAICSDTASAVPPCPTR